MHRTDSIRLLAVLLALAIGAPAAYATRELAYDNDTDAMVPGAATTDRNYTFGARAAWFGAPGVLPRAVRGLARRINGADATPHVSLAIAQALYTPDALSNPNPIANDRPYAAWLHADATVAATTPTRARALTLTLGVVGPFAQGEEVQAWWHRREHVRLPRGWRWQLVNEPTLGVAFDERWRPWGARRHADVVPHVRLAAGNVSTEAAAGATVRLGWLANDFGPGAPSGPEAAVHATRAYVFARAEGRAVARDLFLDGNTFASGPSVHHEPFVGEAQVGASLHRGALGVRYTFSYTTQQFRERADAHEYGSVVLSF